MMKFHRPKRISSLIKEELSKLLVKEIEIPDSLITITDVEVSNNLENAKVKITVYPPQKSPEALEILNKARGRLQFLLTRKLNIKPMPRIAFSLEPEVKI